MNSLTPISLGAYFSDDSKLSSFASSSSSLQGISDGFNVDASGISVKDSFGSSIEREYKARWLSNRLYKLKQFHSAERAEGIAEIEFQTSHVVRAEIGKELQMAREKANNMHTYCQVLLQNQKDPSKIITFEKVFAHRGYMEHFYEPSGMAAPFEEPPFEPPEGLTTAAGVILQLRDGRLMLVEPAGRFMGYSYMFPKGGVNPGESLHETAIRETLEESGLEVELTGFVGDLRGISTWNRFYTGKLVGGDPSNADFETSNVCFVPLDQVEVLLEKNIPKFFCGITERLLRI